jgi:hypothetical protein
MSPANQNPFAPTDRVLRQFATMWVVFFAAIAARQEFHHHRRLLAIALAILSLTIGPLGMVWPRIIKPIFVGWMGLAYPIGWVVSRVVLGVIFYGLFTPMAWVFRLIGRDALVLKPQPHAATYWCTKPGADDQAQYLRQF